MPTTTTAAAAATDPTSVSDVTSVAEGERREERGGKKSLPFVAARLSMALESVCA